MPTQAIPFSPDGAWYSGLALNIYQGQGYVDLDGTLLYTRPLFPTLLATTYTLFGTEPFSAFVVVRISFLANILLVTLLARRLYGCTAGLVAGLITACAYTLNEWSTWVNLDLVLPTFILFFIYFYHLALHEQKKLHALLSGICLAFAILVKETALFFTPLPALSLLLMPKHRSYPQRWSIVIWTWMASIVTLLPWFIYTTYQTQNPFAMIGRTPLWASNKLLNQLLPVSSNIAPIERPSSLIAIINTLLESFTHFYQWHIAANFVIAPIFAISLGLVLLSALFGSSNSRYLLCNICLYLPMIVLQGVVGFRSRQSLILIFLLIIVTSYSITLPLRLNLPRLNIGNRTRVFVTALILALVLIQQSQWHTLQKWLNHLQEFNTLITLRNSEPISEYPIRAPQPWWPSSAIVTAAPQFATWAEQQQLQSGTRFLSPSTSIIRYANLTTLGQYNFMLLRRDGLDGLTPYDAVQISLHRPNSTQLNNATPSVIVKESNLRVHTQQSILNTITQNQIDYIITGHPEKWLATYFISHPDFLKVADLEYGTLQVFQVLAPQPSVIEYPPSIDRQVQKWLQEVETLQPNRHKVLLTDLFMEWLGWTEAEIKQRLMADPKTLYHAYSFLYRRYASWAIDNWDYEAAMYTQLNKTAIDRANPWPYVTLGALYREQGTRIQEPLLLQSAVDAYDRALDLAPDNWRAAWAIMQIYKDDPTLIDDALLTTALTTYEQAVQRYPDNPRPYNELANIYRQLQRHEDAIELYHSGLERGIKNGDLYYGLGRTYEMVEQVDKAVEIYRAGSRWTPIETQSYTKIIKRLEALDD